MNRKAVATVLAAMTAVSLAACGNTTAGSAQSTSAGTADQAAAATSEQAAGDDSAAAASDTADSNDGRTEITFWHSMGGGNGELLDAMVAKYNASQDKYKVTATYQGDYYTSIANAKTAIASGNGPDLIQSGTGQVGLLSNEDGIVANMYDYLNRGEGLSRSDFYDGFTYMYETDKNGEKYLSCLPMGSSTPVLYCNKTLLDKAGVSVPTTWKEMEDVCSKLVDGGYCSYGFAQPRDAWYFWMAIPNYTGESVFADDGKTIDCKDAVVKTYTYAEDLISRKYFYPGPESDGDTILSQMIQSQEVAFFINSIGGLQDMETAAQTGGFELEVANVPAGATAAVPSGGNVLVMLQGDQDKMDGVWDFEKWLYTNDDGMPSFIANSGYFAPTKAVTDSAPVREKFQDANYKNAYSAIDNINNDHYLVKGFSDLSTPIMAFMDACFYDQEDVASQYDILKEASDEALAEANEQ